MDEPLSNLDAKLRVGMRASLAQLHARLVGDKHLRDARSDRGDDARSSRRRDARRADRPGRRAATALPGPERSLRRGVHRLAVDEPRRGDRGRRRGRVRAVSRPSRRGAAPARGVDRVVLGIRPEAFDDAALRAGRACRASRSRSTCSRSSAPTAYVFFHVAAPRVTIETRDAPEDEASILAEDDSLSSPRGSTQRRRRRSALRCSSRSIRRLSLLRSPDGRSLLPTTS